MSNSQVETCPICSVKIEGGEKVVFSSGSSGTRARLWARVCHHVQKSGCINQDQEAIGPISGSDYFKPI